LIPFLLSGGIRKNSQDSLACCNWWSSFNIAVAQPMASHLMIRQLSVENYKSLERLTLDLGRVTVLIGENGSGKSNILEAIVLLGAAAAGKLENEFLVSRGVRVTSDETMMSAFRGKRKKTGSKVHLVARNAAAQNLDLRISPSRDKKQTGSTWSMDMPKVDVKMAFGLVDSASEKQKEMAHGFTAKFREVLSKAKRSDVDARKIVSKWDDTCSLALLLVLEKNISTIKAAGAQLGLDRFLIYSPEISALRKFEDEGQLQPLGIRGEGLFKLLQSFGMRKAKAQLNQLKQSMALTGWFVDFAVPKNLAPGQARLRVFDKYVSPSVELDQRSANEGFLLLLFYFALFISSATPRFFAIDNVDASLNPRLCEELMRRICQLAERYKKQVIVTTHNPAILDGLDLKDSNHALYAVSRNELGRTTAYRIRAPEPANGDAPLKLSHAFLRGLIGGLPKNF
jgi:predicted ATPase